MPVFITVLLSQQNYKQGSRKLYSRVGANHFL
jgi:hypothetical protein